MNNGTFMDLISVNYDNIRSLFKTRLYNIGMSFDDDSFNDAFIKCAQKFGNDIISYEYTIKYFWKAYINTIRANISNARKINIVPFDIEIHDTIDDNDDDYAVKMYDIVMKDICNEFGEDNMIIYSLYKFHNYTKEQLAIDDNFEKTIKAIDKFIKNKYKRKRKR